MDHRSPVDCPEIINRAVEWFSERREHFEQWCKTQRMLTRRMTDWELVKGFVLKENEPFDSVRHMTQQHEAIHEMLHTHPRRSEIDENPRLRQQIVGEWIAKHGKENREAELMHQLYALEAEFECFRKLFPVPPADHNL